MTTPIRTVLFDIGGVVVDSPIHGAGDVERELRLPPDWVGVAIGARGSTGTWARLERGELRFPEAYPLLESELNDVAFVRAAYQSYLARRRQPRLPDAFAPAHIDARTLVNRMMRRAREPHPLMLGAIRRLRQAGVTVAALTNTFLPPADAAEAAHLGLDFTRSAELRSQFDAWFDSAELGMRKPEPRFFVHALDVLHATPANTAFLDDIGANLRPAREMGLATILVDSSDVLAALQQLEARTDVDLGLGTRGPQGRARTHRL